MPNCTSPTGAHHFLLPSPREMPKEPLGVCKWCNAERTHSNFEDRAFDQVRNTKRNAKGDFA